jgi:hypothetical protein
MDYEAWLWIKFAVLVVLAFAYSVWKGFTGR